jgi:hypothetical protein
VLEAVVNLGGAGGGALAFRPCSIWPKGFFILRRFGPSTPQCSCPSSRAAASASWEKRGERIRNAWRAPR